MMNLADSDLFFYIGLGLEGFVEKAKGTLKNEHVTMVAAADKLKLPTDSDSQEEEEQEEEHHEHHGDINPHVWLDPIYSKEMAAVIRDALIKQMPQQKELFNENFQKLSLQLD
jgi:zinc transport system substrate-binding protein